MKLFFDIESLKLDKQFLCVVFGKYGNYCLLFFDITSNFLEKNVYANLLTRCDDACVITPYLFIYVYTSFYTSTEVIKPCLQLRVLQQDKAKINSTHNNKWNS